MLQSTSSQQVLKNIMEKGIKIGPKETDIQLNDKENIEEYNIQEIRGWTIDELNLIEEKINKIITHHFKPEKVEEFQKIILNSSIINTGAKLKILKNIDWFDKKIISFLQTISSIRNAFAHIPIKKSANVTLENRNGKLIWLLESVTSQLDIMNSAGEIKTKNAKELITEFKSAVKEVNKYLDSKLKTP